MLYVVGNSSEAAGLETKLPAQVFTDLLHEVAILDREYGRDRNYRAYGGYSLVAETAEDVLEVKKYVNIDSYPWEWVERVGEDCGYLRVLYILNDDFSVVLYLPAAVAPDAIWEGMED